MYVINTYFDSAPSRVFSGSLEDCSENKQTVRWIGKRLWRKSNCEKVCFENEYWWRWWILGNDNNNNDNNTNNELIIIIIWFADLTKCNTNSKVRAMSAQHTSKVYSFIKSQVTYRTSLQSKYKLYEIRPTGLARRLATWWVRERPCKQINSQRKLQLNTISFLRWCTIYVMNRFGAGGNRSRGLSPGRRDS